MGHVPPKMMSRLTSADSLLSVIREELAAVSWEWPIPQELGADSRDITIPIELGADSRDITIPIELGADSRPTIARIVRDSNISRTGTTLAAHVVRQSELCVSGAAT